MKVFVEEILKDLYMLRINDDRTKFFEALWNIPEGVTYNAYLLLSGNKNILFDSWKQSYANIFIEKLSEIINPSKLDYIVIHHMEQDHSGSIPMILDINSNVKILGHLLVKNMFRSFYGINPNFHAVRDGEEVLIGNIKLRFIHTPFLHWPETMMTFIPQYNILLSCDAFGGFSIPRSIYDDDEKIVSNYLKYVRKYIVTVVGRYNNFILNAIDKLKKNGIEPKIIAPAHGLVFRNNPNLIVRYYADLAKGVSKSGKILVIYSSMYGSTEKAVETAVDYLRNKGFSPIIYRFTDMIQTDISSIISDMIDSEAVIIGTSTYEANIFPTIRYLIDIMIEKVRVRKKVLILSSYGWGGVAATFISRKLDKAGFQIIDKIEFQGQPDENVFEKIRKSIDKMVG